MRIVFLSNILSILDELLPDNADAKRLTLEEQEDLCNIRLVISRYKRTGDKKKQERSIIESSTLPMDHIVHEDSKPAQWGLSTRCVRGSMFEMMTMLMCC
jgi:hypothetical protein